MQLADRATSPADVHAERHHPIDEVVARADPIEQRRGRSRPSPRRSAAAGRSRLDPPFRLFQAATAGSGSTRGRSRRARAPRTPRPSARPRAGPSPAVSRIGSRTLASNRSTARTASRRSASSASRARPSRSPTGRPNSSRRNAVRITSASAAEYRTSPSTRRPIVIPSRSTAWISDAGTPEADGQIVEGEDRVVGDPRAARDRDGGREIGVRGTELAAHHPPDRGKGQALALQIADPPDPLGVPVVVPGHAAFARRLRQEPARLIEAHGVDRHVAGRRELFDPVPHDRTLYECALQSSHRALERRRRTGRRLRCAAWSHVRRAIGLGVVLACVFGTMARRHRLEVPVRRTATSATAGSTDCCATPTSCRCSRPSSSPAGACRSSTDARSRRTTATSTRC